MHIQCKYINSYAQSISNPYPMLCHIYYQNIYTLLTLYFTLPPLPLCLHPGDGNRTSRSSRSVCPSVPLLSYPMSLFFNQLDMLIVVFHSHCAVSLN